MKISNGQDLQWRIHLANFIISLIYVSFNLNSIFRRIYYLIGVLFVVAISWAGGKIFQNHFNILNFKLLVLVFMIALAFFNIKKSKTIIESSENDSGYIVFNIDDLLIISFCSFGSSYFEINFGVISCLVFLTLKKKIKIIELSNVVYFSMLLYSILNFIWYNMKYEIKFDESLEIFVFSGLVLGAIFSMLIKSKLQDKIITKIILISMLIYSVTLFFNNALV